MKKTTASTVFHVGEFVCRIRWHCQSLWTHDKIIWLRWFCLVYLSSCKWLFVIRCQLQFFIMYNKFAWHSVCYARHDNKQKYQQLFCVNNCFCKVKWLKTICNGEKLSCYPLLCLKFELCHCFGYEFQFNMHCSSLKVLWTLNSNECALLFTNFVWIC